MGKAKTGTVMPSVLLAVLLGKYFQLGIIQSLVGMMLDRRRIKHMTEKVSPWGRNVCFLCIEATRDGFLC